MITIHRSSYVIHAYTCSYEGLYIYNLHRPIRQLTSRCVYPVQTCLPCPDLFCLCQAQWQSPIDKWQQQTNVPPLYTLPCPCPCPGLPVPMGNWAFHLRTPTNKNRERIKGRHTGRKKAKCDAARQLSWCICSPTDWWTAIDYLICCQASATPLQRAAAEGHVDIVHQLLKHGADVNHQDSLVTSVCHTFFFAHTSRHKESVSVFLELNECQQVWPTNMIQSIAIKSIFQSIIFVYHWIRTNQTLSDWPVKIELFKLTEKKTINWIWKNPNPSNQKV